MMKYKQYVVSVFAALLLVCVSTALAEGDVELNEEW